MSPKAIYCIFHLYEILRIGKSIQTEIRLAAAAWKLGYQGTGGLMAKGYRVSSWGDKDVLKITVVKNKKKKKTAVVRVTHFVNILEPTELYTF